MGKDFTLTSHVLEDDIVLDGIKGINILKDNSNLFGYVGGGMAVSSYLPEEIHRASIDLDFNLFWGGSTGKFWEISEPLIEYLSKKGYYIKRRRQGSTLDINYGDKSDMFVIQHKRRSKNNFAKNIHILEREIENRKLIHKCGFSYDALSPEDLMLRKLFRINNFSNSYKVGFPKLRNYTKLREDIKKEKNAIISSPENTTMNGIIHLRMEHDLYDIQRLGRYAGANLDYLETAISDWEEDPGKYIDKLQKIWASFDNEAC